MASMKKARAARLLLFVAAALILNCNLTTQVKPIRLYPTRGAAMQTETVIPTMALNEQTPVPAAPTPLSTLPTPEPQLVSSAAVEPAGCLSAEAEKGVASERESLALADQMLDLQKPLSERILPKNWNAYTQTYSSYAEDVLSLNMGDVQNKFMIQKIMNALQVSGFITWLRNTPKQHLHILAIPVRSGNWQDSPWAPYAQAYWQDRNSVPSGDPFIVPVVKIPPCRWMAEYGYPVVENADWWPPEPSGWPDYAAAAASYLADTTEAAAQVAHRIKWLGEGGREGPTTMCGPLAWSILKDAGALPPDWGGWSEGSKSFWLARPRSNGRPWSLFPSNTYKVYSFREPLGKFDFSQFPLYPGDFIYTYSAGDGFDHMMVITELDGDGNVYSVTNKIQVVPEKKVTIERLLILNLHDPSIGLARNQWANDRVNGRTGHAGFDVFRWSWMEKDILGQPAVYTVQPGDTLRMIAVSWKTPVEQIARYNEITLDTVLTVGQELKIPPNETAGLR